MKLLLSLFLSVWTSTALAQVNPAVKQSGNITQGHQATWLGNGVIQDGGGQSVNIPVSGSSTTSIPSNSTYYCGASGCDTTTKYATLSSVDMTLGQLYFATTASPGSSNTVTATLYVGTYGTALTATSVTCQFTAGSTSCADLTHTATMATGQAWAVRVVTSTSATATSGQSFSIHGSAVYPPPLPDQTVRQSGKITAGHCVTWLSNGVVADCGFNASNQPGALASPTAVVGLAVVNGTSNFAMRSDAAPALSASLQLPNSYLANMVARTVKGNNTNSTGAPADLTDVVLDKSFTMGQNCPANTTGCFTSGVVPYSGDPFWPDPPACTNPSAFTCPTVLNRIGEILSSQGTVVVGSANQFALLVDVHVPVVNALASFQKNAIEAVCSIDEPSPLLPSTEEHGCVGAEARGVISSTNSAGQAWGGVLNASITTGGDGYLLGLEVDLANNGTDQPLIGHDRTKNGISIDSIGAASGTAALSISGGTAKWHRGIYASTIDLVSVGSDPNSNFIEYCVANCATSSPTDAFKVRQDGFLSTVFTTGAVDFVSFVSTTGGFGNPSGVLFGVLPGTGVVGDEFDLDFYFKNAASANYRGAWISATQSTPATGGTTQFALNVKTSGTGSTPLAVNASAVFPGSNGVVSSGATTGYWSTTYSNFFQAKPILIAALPTCNGGLDGEMSFVTDATTNVNNTVVVPPGGGGGTHHAQLVCANSQWRLLGGT